jgi:hypothetical protein
LLADIGRETDDFTIIVIVFQPRNDHGGVQAAAVSKYYFLYLILCHFFTPFIKRKTPVFTGVKLPSIQVLLQSCPTTKSPGVSSPATATKTGTGVFQDYWHHDSIFLNTSHGNMSKKRSAVKPENKFLFDIRANDGLNFRAQLQLIEAMSNKFCYFVFSWAARASYYRL